MGKKQNIYHAHCEFCGEQDVFLDIDGNILSWWDCGDASYRSEYMDDLLLALGYKVLKINPKDRLVWKSIKEVLLSVGAYEEELDSYEAKSDE